MFKNSLKKLCAFACAAAMVAQFAIFAPAVGAINFSEPVKIDEQVVPGRTITCDKREDKGSSTILETIPFTNPGQVPYVISFDLTLDTLLRDWDQSFGDGDRSRNTFYIEVFGPKTGAVLSATTSTTVQGKPAMNFGWKTDKGTSLPGAALAVGDTYKIQMTVLENNTITLDIFDGQGTSMTHVTGLSMRSATAGSARELQIGMNARQEGQEDSVTIGDVSVYASGADSMDASINGVALSETATTIDCSAVAVSELPVEIVAKAAGKDVTADYTVVSSVVDAVTGEPLAENSGIGYNKGVLRVDPELASGAYNLKLKAQLSGYDVTKVEFPFALDIPALTAAEKVAEKKRSLTLKDKNGENIVLDGTTYPVSDDLILDKGNSDGVMVAWEAVKQSGTEWVTTDTINPMTGVVMPTDEDETLKLVATIKHKDYVEGDTSADNEKLKAVVEFPVTVAKPKTYNQAALDAIVLKNLDDKQIFDPTTVLAQDITVPTNDLSAAPCEYVSLSWSSSNDSILKVNNAKKLVEVYLTDTNAHTVTLKATASYVKNGTTLGTATKEFPITVKADKDTILPKYAVRFDAAMKVDIPETTKSDLDLPDTGLFGSRITWVPSHSSIFSNTGKLIKLPTTATTVTLTETISKGTYSAQNVYTTKVPARNSGGTGGGGNGSGSSNDDDDYNQQWTGNPINPNPTPTPTVKPSQAPFTDTSDVAWANDAINALYTKGAIKGKTATEFAPNDNVTRAEFAQILVSALGLTGKQGALNPVTVFSDVSTSDWYYTAVAAAYNTGVIKGMGNGEFGVNEKITRQDMAVMIDRAAQAVGKTLPSVNPAINFADGASIADYAKESVSTLQKAGIINGVSDTEFAPTQTATRAQAAQMVYGLIK
jgi:hypothetical protein